MTASEFLILNDQNKVPYEWVGQGFGYKIDTPWDKLTDDEIIYIPEYAYNNDGYVETTYTKKDFKQLVTDYGITENIDNIAQDLFQWVDWQFPETVIDEGYLDDCFGEYIMEEYGYEY